MAKVDASGATIETYIYGLGVNAPDYILKDGVRYRLVKDHLGTPRLVVNATTGEVVKRLDLDEFGNITAETGTFDIPFGFAGGIRDTDTGLTKFGARWYDPETGRWLEKEPLGFRGSMNFYAYAKNDPINYSDLTGLEPNGCGWSTSDFIPESTYYFDFTDPCNLHDYGYEDLTRHKADVDYDFLKNMQQSCYDDLVDNTCMPEEERINNYLLCMASANVYYSFVTVFGFWPYMKAQLTTMFSELDEMLENMALEGF